MIILCTGRHCVNLHTSNPLLFPRYNRHHLNETNFSMVHLVAQPTRHLAVKTETRHANPTYLIVVVILSIAFRSLASAQEATETNSAALTAEVVASGPISNAEDDPLFARIKESGSASLNEQINLIGVVKSHLKDEDFSYRAYSYAEYLALEISNSENRAIAASFYDYLSELMRSSEDKILIDRAERLENSAKRCRLVGGFMDLSGETLDGEVFDWASYRDKVVLVDFWASWCGHCLAELPNMKKNLERYGDRGFAIVGVNLDRTIERGKRCVKENEITWSHLFSSKEGEQLYDNPIARRYGILAAPTAILVDQKGNVVSLSARGQELDRLLIMLLGPPEPEITSP